MATNNNLNEATAASGKVLQGQGVGSASAFSTATYPSTATGTGTLLRADGTNWSATTSTYPNTNAINTLLYASSTNVMSALATANSGVLATNSSGVPSIDTTNFAVLSTGLQLKGNNTNTAPPAGFYGEIISSAVTGVSLTNNTAKSVTSISITAGVWNVSILCYGISSDQTGTKMQAGISATNNTFEGNFGDKKGSFTTVGAFNECSICIKDYRLLLSSTTTYYLVALMVDDNVGTRTASGRISATRVG